ncbi:MAG: EAL domain-containing protein [Dechloromonas sp.]|nr:EAL domain-containing protein [Dechloromonas sp.]
MTQPTEPFDDFRKLAENLPDVVVRYDRTGRPTYVNTAYRQLNSEQKSLTPETTNHSPLHERLRQVIGSGSHSEAIDLSWQDASGHTQYFELHTAPEFDSEGKIDSIVAIARNVSKQRETHRQLCLLKFALDHVAEAIYLIDENAKLLHVNDASCRALGYAYGELMKMSVFDIDPDYSPNAWNEHWQQMLHQGSRTLTSHHKKRDGCLFPVEIKAARFEFDGSIYNLALVQDITERTRAEHAARRREHEFRTLVENSPDTIARYDRKCRRLYGNASLARLAGVSVDSLIGKRPTENPLGASAFAYENALRTVIASGERREFEHTWPTTDGRMICSHLMLTPELSEDGQVASVLVVGRDITALKESELRLRQAEAMARLGHWQWEYSSKKITVSEEMCRIFGKTAAWQPRIDQILGMIVDEDRESLLKVFNDACARKETELALGGYRILIANQVLHLHTHIRLEYDQDGKPRRLIGTTQDISELKSYESRLQEIAFHDALTGLPNRTLLGERLNHCLEKAERHRGTLGLMILDIDHFKEVNDTHGHDLGDILLHESAERLRRLVRDYDTVARLGGDEFAIVLPNIREAADLGSISRKILAALAKPFQLGNQEAFITASIGIAVFPSDGRSAADLFQYADSALYDAKGRGRAGFRFYSTELTAKSKERAMLETALRRAEAADELEVFYQPKIDLANGCLVGAEALIRWRHPSLGLVQPDKFIGIAEDTGLIVNIGSWVLKQACLAAKRWNGSGGRQLKIAVNLSSRQFRDNDLVATVTSTLEASGCKPSWLEFEITESLLLDDNKEIGIALKAFREMGISIAIDDFGTGYSSLAYLKRFPINVLKIDRSFISDVMLDRDSTELVKGIITMAHSLRLELVAEGIETEEQECFLQAHGCHLGQGYRYGKPISGEAFERHPQMVTPYQFPGIDHDTSCVDTPRLQ